MAAQTLVPLADHEHGTIYLHDGNRARGATARVFTRRKGELVELPVWADTEKTRRLAQPLTAGRDGRLPGLVHRRPLEVEATWRGRTITTAEAVEAAERAHAALEAERASLASLSRTIPRGQPLTLVISDPAGTEVAEVNVRDYQPVYEPNLGIDALWLAPGFGIDTATDLGYFDTHGPTGGEHAVFGVVPPFDLVLVNP